MAKQPTQARVRRREKKNITAGVAHVNATFNNTMITITDAQGNAISWSTICASGGSFAHAARTNQEPCHQRHSRGPTGTAVGVT